MYCKYCGNNLDNDAKFCSSCGARVEEAEQPAAEEIASYVYDDVMPDPYEEAKSSAGRSILALGICSLAFTLTFYFALVGWILAAVCRGKIRDYEMRFGPVSGPAKVGRGLSLGGLIGGIIFTVLVTILFIAIIALV